jgi:hypothetical protein
MSKIIIRRSLAIALRLSIFTTVILLSIVILSTIFNLVLGYRSLGDIILPLPTAEMVARDYLNKLTSGDTKHLADLVPDYQKYRGAEIRNFEVTTESLSGNSDHYFELTTATFQYRVGSTDWQFATFTLMTDSNVERQNTFMQSLPFRKVIRRGG